VSREPRADPVRQIADAVLYEGYVLWPYTRSALKNQQRFTFGGVYPQGWPEDRSEFLTECLLEDADKPRVEVRVRFLQVIERCLRNAAGEAVDELAVGEQRHLAWEEAVEREIVVAIDPPCGGEQQQRGVRAAVTAPIAIPAAEDEEPLAGPDGEPAGAIVRSWGELRGAVETSAESLGERVWRVRVRVGNDARWEGEPRAKTLERTFCSTHVVLRAAAGRFVSLTDPPAELRQAAAGCRNEGAWPVLVGEPGDRSTVLASPIILEDYPRVAPESPGDLFDGGEIDQLLVLNILSLTDEEKAEMRDSDPRAREILERTEALSDQELMRLHGAIREFAVRRAGRGAARA
jgi:hypothetical protein